MKSVELNPDELPSAYALIHFVPSLYLTGLSCACNDRVRDDPVYCAKAVGGFTFKVTCNVLWRSRMK
jgi:hypothetical protein